eukprot:gene15914-25945_t
MGCGGAGTAAAECARRVGVGVKAAGRCGAPPPLLLFALLLPCSLLAAWGRHGALQRRE